MIQDLNGVQEIKNFFETYIDLQKYDLKTIKELEEERKKGGGQANKEKVEVQERGDGDTYIRRDEYDPKDFVDNRGGFDFTKAPGYDESIVRNNLNKVIRPSTAIVSAPPLEKIIEVVAKPNYIDMNKNGMRKVHGLNQRRMAYMQQSEQRKTERLTPNKHNFTNGDRLRP